MNNAPLAEILRPQTLDQFIGQEHLVGKNGFLRKLIENDQIISLIFWGPPGSGKTTLARIIAHETKSHFVSFSAVVQKLEDVKKTIKEAGERLQAYNQKTILFIDEIHRFNKAQQDGFLPYVEKGTIILIGATTENPSFEIIGPLLSRSSVVVFKRLTEEELAEVTKRGLDYLKLKIASDAKEFLLNTASGDARIILNVLEISSKLLNPREKTISKEIVEQALQKKLTYDKAGDEHYNTISAFIKSMRAGNPDSALYYLARMVEAGEDPLFIARRMVVFASEDIGMAQPTALVVANSVFRACETIGYPECQENLAHGVVYLTLAKKDRSAYDAYMAALSDVKQFGNLPIPLKILNSPTKLMKNLGYGKDYDMYNKENLLPEKIRNHRYYHNLIINKQH